MASGIEQKISRLLRAILRELAAGADIADSQEFTEVLSGLGSFLPLALGEVHAQWHELDGIIPVLARKTGELEVEIMGQCILVSDQTLTPVHLRLQVSPFVDEISWAECRLGEVGKHGMVRVPYESLRAANKRLYALERKPERIDWAYKVTFGQKRG